MKKRQTEERELSDERILVSGDFVVQALKGANELHERSIKSRIFLTELIKRVSKDRNIDLKELISSKRKKGHQQYQGNHQLFGVD